MSWYHGISIPRAVKAVLSGQVVSLLVTGTGVCSQLLAQKYGVNAPATQSFLNYVLLAIVYGIFLFAIKRRENSVIHTFKTKSHIYLPLAIIDVEANYLGTHLLRPLLHQLKNSGRKLCLAFVFSANCPQHSEFCY
jgi:hypothetical protein